MKVSSNRIKGEQPMGSINSSRANRITPKIPVPCTEILSPLHFREIGMPSGKFVRSVVIAVLLLAVFVVFPCPQAFSYTPHVNETISSDETWYTGETHLIQGSCYVTAGFTLTVQAGVVIKFDTGADLQVNGTLNAPGISGSPIYFTSINDNAVGDPIPGSTGSPAAGDWDYVFFDSISANEGSGTLAYCTVRYGGGQPAPSHANIYASADGILTLTNCTISNSRWHLDFDQLYYQ
jgi:hypothetical protein